jgi:inner membrane transporter RhtA
MSIEASGWHHRAMHGEAIRAHARSRSVLTIPPHAYFVGSAFFHYLGPAFAVLLFAHVGVPGVAWFRIASAAAIFAAWRRPWRVLQDASWDDRVLLVAFGVILAAMNLCFYVAIAKLPLATVGAVEFLGPIGLAAAGLRSRRNLVALSLSVAGVYALTHLRFSGEATAYAFAFTNCALFVLYIVLGHRIARHGSGKSIDILGCAMCVALLAITPIGVKAALPAFLDIPLVLAGIAVGLTSSVIPYVLDQLAMNKLPRSSFALFLSLLPLTATIVGVVVLHQIPSYRDAAGILLVMSGVAIHRPREAA